ncbi:unnamed protein product [Trifolium pratense]|uniref:Uncharacterized protein n=1 Tax=Trifolium pratense TaxID=57577 RepID=A0ACB0K3I3_TRIPR|nr:unnamed protein product [Trifolium pratense]
MTQSMKVVREIEGASKEHGSLVFGMPLHTLKSERDLKEHRLRIICLRERCVILAWSSSSNSYTSRNSGEENDPAHTSISSSFEEVHVNDGSSETK